MNKKTQKILFCFALFFLMLSLSNCSINLKKAELSESQLIYDGNGANGIMPPQIFNGEKIVTVKNNLFNPSGTNIKIQKEDFVLVGGDLVFDSWNTQADGSGKKYLPGNKITVPNNTKLVLYAQWTRQGNYSFNVVLEYGNPAQTVSFINPFYICNHEVTVEEWNTFCQHPQDAATQDNKPITRVSWYDAIVYCNVRSIADGFTPVYILDGKRDPSQWTNTVTVDQNGIYTIDSNQTADIIKITKDDNANGYRLPLLCEWQYAALGDFKDSEYWNGINDSRNPNFLVFSGYNGENIDDYYQYAVLCTSDSTSEYLNMLEPVKQKQPNSYGIYDMTGNAWEWVWDVSIQSADRRYTPGGGVQSSISNSFRTSINVVGFRYYNDKDFVWDLPADYRDVANGFRVVRTCFE